MPLIDDDGDLFGLVNVVDALAVLLVLAVVAAGTAFVLQPDTQPSPDLTTTKVTLDLGTQPQYLVSRISAGDSFSPGGSSTLTVTDVYLTPARDGLGTRVLLRVRLEGRPGETTLTYAGAPPRLGRKLAIKTDVYQVAGTIRDVAGDETLPTTETRVLLVDEVSASTASAIQAGDAYRLAGHTVATVASVTAYDTTDPDRKRVFVGLTLETIALEDSPHFAGVTVREGATLPFRTNDYALNGTVRRVGATELPGEPATRTVTLRLESVRPTLADSLRAGMTERTGGDTLARITDVAVDNATVVLTSDDGQIYQREHPVLKDVLLTAELAVRDTPTGLSFKGRPLRHGSTIVLDLGRVTIEATVVSL